MLDAWANRLSARPMLYLSVNFSACYLRVKSFRNNTTRKKLEGGMPLTPSWYHGGGGGEDFTCASDAVKTVSKFNS